MSIGIFDAGAQKMRPQLEAPFTGETANGLPKRDIEHPHSGRPACYNLHDGLLR